MGKPGIVYLYGWGGCGKSVLKRLLDGHPQLAVTPDHDTLINTFALDNVTGELKDERGPILAIEDLRKLLLNSKYYFLQRIHEGVQSWMPASANDNTSFDIEGFDFYEYEREWVNKINQDREYTPENILYRILQTLFEHWKTYEYDESKCRYFVGTGCKRKYPMRYLLENYSNSKIIFVHRDPRGIIATEGSRKKKRNNIDELLRSGELFEIMQQLEYAKSLKDEFPERVYISSFEKYILETKDAMPPIADFLEIDYDPILEYATLAGEKIGSQSGENYVGEINDDWRELLTQQQQQVANLQLGNQSILRAETPAIYPYLISRVRMAKKIAKHELNKIRVENVKS